MTASTRTVTLSRVMPSWAGTGIVMICMLTFCNRSATGTSIVNPGCRTLSWTRPNRKTTPRSYCLTTRMLFAASQSMATAAAPAAVRLYRMSMI
nr:hypothetical protein CPGR_04309 [Mycolicibacterium fortuitum subsp. fortuitum DSM 46621 = ATCC 6841 = JCM 6387]